MKKTFILFFSLVFTLCSLTISAQEINLVKPPIISLFEYLHVSRADVLKSAPHFPWKEQDVPSDFQTKLNHWLEHHSDEWKSLQSMEVFTQHGVGWITYGIPQKYIIEKKRVNSSWYQWYEAAGITSERKDELFPHFPDLDNTLKGDTQGLNFDRRVAIWERLYPKEYVTFLNTPELKKLNPFAPNKITIEYVPRFIGAEISETAPVLVHTGNALEDQYQYELKYRDWLFVYMPEKFNKLFGNDYDYPEWFNAEEYRKDMKGVIKRQKDPDWGTGRQGK